MPAASFLKEVSSVLEGKRLGLWYFSLNPEDGKADPPHHRLAPTL